MKKGNGKIIVGVVFLIIAVIALIISVSSSSVGRAPGLIFLFTFLVSVVFLIWGAINLLRENKQLGHSLQINPQINPQVNPQMPANSYQNV